MGDFNARLDNAADSFPEHPQLLDMYPQLGQARLSPLPMLDQTQQAGAF